MTDDINSREWKRIKNQNQQSAENHLAKRALKGFEQRFDHWTLFELEPMEEVILHVGDVKTHLINSSLSQYVTETKVK